MKKERTLLQKLIPYFFLATGIPIALFAIVSQYRLQRNLSDNLKSQINMSLTHADRHINMVLDKYDTLLDELCKNEQMLLSLAEQNAVEEQSEGQEAAIQEQLRQISDGDSAIVGMEIHPSKGGVVYYGDPRILSAKSSWSMRKQAEEANGKTIYRGVAQAVGIKGQKANVFCLVKELGNAQDNPERKGTVILILDEQVVKEALISGESSNFLCQDGIVVSAYDGNDIGKSQKQVEAGDYRITRVKNQRCGLVISNRQPLDGYYKTLYDQGGFWLLIAIATMGMSVALGYILTRPYLREIDYMAEAMEQVKRGNLQMRLPIKEGMTVEIKKISSGFNGMVMHMEELIEQVKTAIMDQRAAELSALEAQIDPHFLYNTLDAINWKAIEKGEFEISEMVGALADILRYTVNNAGDETTIEQELYWLHQYILLQSAKAEKNLRVVVDVPESLRGCKIHKLLLQPFVENSIKHGMREKSGECIIEIFMQRLDEQIHIIVKDNGCGMGEEVLSQLNAQEGRDEKYGRIHLGIMNVRKRLELYYGNRAMLYFESEQQYYTKVHLFIPMSLSVEGGNEHEDCSGGR